MMCVTQNYTEILKLQTEIVKCQSELIIRDAPPHADQHSKQLRNALTRVTHEWFQKFCGAGCDDDLIHSLPDAWIAELGDSTGLFATWYEAEFMSWGQDDLPEVIAGFLDGSAEGLVDEAFSDLISVFPRFDIMARITRLQARVRFLQDSKQIPFPHRPVKTGSANVRERLASAFQIPSSF